ncbi:uncharacterized protein LOC133202576 [Saccostrea echinata]|uniref:uncharacterized protein LOC133202576 n=1 Tax=Saccostrea echinata TaxID=191078 RepID=UPI002A8082AD|nr:uncharacterized protein LOC133202576 [Saccostrea echinata]
MLQIKSVNCDMVVSVPTGKRHSRIDSDHPSRAFDVNTKLALGMLHAGIGQKKVSMLLSVLNIPSMCHKTLKKTEREVGKALKEVAKKSCDDMTAVEKESSSTPNELSVSFDGGWQKRASGRSYSSLSGHAAMIGNETGKIINFATRNSYCKVCDNSKKSGKVLPIHDCRKNWSKSAKAMEPDMCIQMLQDLGQNDVNVSTIIMDNDSTTVARARLEVNPALKKQSDKNHTMKQFTNKLYDLKKNKNYKELNTKTINHISKCFKYCISQNQEDLISLKKNLEAITPHVYGDHSLCDTWCGFLSSPETYKPQQLPYHRYLSNQQLKSDLSSLFGFYISQAEKLINLGSTQANESFNNTVASKTPKSTFYSGSESNDFRIAAAVAQKNLGHQYVIQVNEKLLLSPGQVTSSSAKKTDLKRKQDKEREDTAAYKKNRAMKKIDSQKSQESSEIREGTTYKTCVDLNNNEEDMENITEIPPPLRKPQSTPIAHDQCTFVYFDLETTGLGKDCEVTQIGACVSEESFSQYVLPSTQSISPSATAVSGIAVKENLMFKNGMQVPCKNTKDAMKTFVAWLKKFSNIVLVVHNAKFDSSVIVPAMQQVGLSANDFIIGFIDTLPLFREAVPNRRSYKQVNLLKDLCTAHYDAHDALADSQALQRLVLHLEISRGMMKKQSFSVEFVIENDNYAIVMSRNASALKHLVDENILSKFTANKIAAFGLHYDHLYIAHQRDPVNGIKFILSEKNMGKVRVTSNCKIIKSLHQYFMNCK